MNLGCFAKKVFEVSRNKIYTFNGLSRSYGISAEEQKIEGKKPSIYIDGINAESIEFNVNLRKSKTIDIEKEINEWKNICYACVPYMLFVGGKPISNNKFILTNVSVDDTEYSPSGIQIKAKLKLQFLEYPRKGVKKDNI